MPIAEAQIICLGLWFFGRDFIDSNKNRVPSIRLSKISFLFFFVQREVIDAPAK